MSPFALRAVAVATALAGLAGPSRAELLICLTVGNQLVQFDSSTPGVTTPAVAVTGLQAGDNLGSIDFRPADGRLYGLGINGSSARLYTLNPTTGAATLASTLSANPGLALLAADFNPVADRLRTVTQFGTNLRTVPATGATTADGTLAYAAGDINFGRLPAVTGVGYTNSFPGAAGTTLYGIDLNMDTLVVQNPNAGTLTTVGQLGVNGSFYAAFDISGASGRGYAALDVNGGTYSGLYAVDLSTGAATAVGQIGSGLPVVIGLAAPIGPAPAVPAPAGLVLAGVAAAALGLRRRLI